MQMQVYNIIHTIELLNKICQTNISRHSESPCLVWMHFDWNNLTVCQNDCFMIWNIQTNMKDIHKNQIIVLIVIH